MDLDVSLWAHFPDVTVGVFEANFERKSANSFCMTADLRSAAVRSTQAL